MPNEIMHLYNNNSNRIEELDKGIGELKKNQEQCSQAISDLRKKKYSRNKRTFHISALKNGNNETDETN